MVGLCCEFALWLICCVSVGVLIVLVRFDFIACCGVFMVAYAVVYLLLIIGFCCLW